jgi:heme/copper-type cytochrome/quinol oxidase subunit 2
MTPEQWNELIIVFRALATPKYTLTGAQDWPMLIALFAVIVFMLGVIITMIAFMWKNTDSKNNAAFDDVWTELRRCQDHCCPLGQRKKS